MLTAKELANNLMERLENVKNVEDILDNCLEVTPLYDRDKQLRYVEILHTYGGPTLESRIDILYGHVVITASANNETVVESYYKPDIVDEIATLFE